MNYASKKLGGYLMGLFVLCGVMVVASTTTQAQYPRGNDPYRNDQYRNDRYRNDRYGNDRYGNDRYGNDRYGNDRYGRNRGDNSYQIAREQGYRNGLATGASDAQRGQSYNPQRSHFWKNGSDGYNSGYGNRGQYKQVFRDAFAQGYREGYQRYGGYNQRGNNGRWGNGRWPR